MYQKIMVPLDGSEQAECVLPQIETMIRESQASDIFFVSVVRPVSVPQIGEYAPVEKVYAEDYLEALVDGFEYNDTRLHIDVIVGGGIAESLAEYAVNNGIDLIVLASHGGSGDKRYPFGSVADRVMRVTSVPVLMVTAPASKTGTK